MSSSRELPRVLVHRGIPVRTRWSLLVTAVRRRFRPASAYFVRLGDAHIPISHDDYGVDWETMRTIVVDRAYDLDYRGAVVVDVGAHKGCFGAYAFEHGARAVISYEPERTNFEFLQQCAAPYRAAGRLWDVHREAVGGTGGSADLHVMGSSWGHAITPSLDAHEDEVGVQRVSVAAIADVLSDASRIAGTDPLVVKVNAEGAECEIILGSPVSGWGTVVELMVEIHSWAPCTAPELAAHLSGAGLLEAPSGPVDWVYRLSRPAEAS